MLTPGLCRHATEKAKARVPHNHFFIVYPLHDDLHEFCVQNNPHLYISLWVNVCLPWILSLEYSFFGSIIIFCLSSNVMEPSNNLLSSTTTIRTFPLVQETCFLVWLSEIIIISRICGGVMFWLCLRVCVCVCQSVCVHVKAF